MSWSFKGLRKLFEIKYQSRMFGRFSISQFSQGSAEVVEFGRIKILGSKKILRTFPHPIWSHILCMHAHPHRREDQLPLRLLRDLHSR